MAAKASLWPAALAGFELMGRRPLAVLAWVLITWAMTQAPLALIIPSMFDQMLPVMEKSLTNPDAVSDADFPFGAFLSMMAVMPLVMLGYLFLVVFVFTAVWRAILFPDQSRFAYLRFSGAEARTFVILLVLAAMFYAAAMIPSTLIVAPVMMGFMMSLEPALAADSLPSAEVFTRMIGLEFTLIGLQLPIVFALAWPFCRLALALPMSLAEGRLRLLDGWGFSRGYGWRLWGVTVSVWFGVMLVQYAVLAAIGLVVWETVRPTFTDVPALFRQYEGLYHAVRPWMLPASLLFSTMMVLAQVVTVAPLARAYQLIARARAEAASAP